MGEIAAVATSICWSFTSIQMTLASRRVGSHAVNRVRLVLALVFLMISHLISHGQLLPLGATPTRWLWLGLSGIVGLVIGDGFLYKAFELIGPRRSMLVMTLVPVISAILAWVLQGDTLTPGQIAASLLTVSGTALVVSEGGPKRPETPQDTPRNQYLLGILAALGGAIGQAGGLVLAKQGLSGDFPALSATAMRMSVATVFLLVLSTIRGDIGTVCKVIKDKKALMLTTGGAFAGTFLGVWLSLYAVQNAPVGIASTLMALSPIILLPLDKWIFHEKIGSRAILGTIAALAGATLIFMT